MSLVYVNKKGGVNTNLFEYISVCYVKPLERAAGVEVCDLWNWFGCRRAGKGVG